MIANIKRNELISGARKAAMLMVLLGEEASGQLMRELSEDEVQSVSREVARLSTISTEEGEAVLEEFYQMCMAREYVSRGGIDYARKLLLSAFGPEAARKLVDWLVKTMGNDTAAFDALQKADPQQLAKFIHSEHPQTIAFILSHLSSTQAAALLISLPAQIRADVALRMAQTAGFGRVQPRVLWGGAGRFGDVQPIGIGRQQRDSGLHRQGECHAGRHHPPPDVRVRGYAAA